MLVSDGGGAAPKKVQPKKREKSEPAPPSSGDDTPTLRDAKRAVSEARGEVREGRRHVREAADDVRLWSKTKRHARKELKNTTDESRQLRLISYSSLELRSSRSEHRSAKTKLGGDVDTLRDRQATYRIERDVPIAAKIARAAGIGNEADSQARGITPEKVARAIVTAAHRDPSVPDEWGTDPAVYRRVDHESDGDWNQANESGSSAFGMFQFLDSTWGLNGVNGSKTTDPVQQATYGLRYIRVIYGSPSGVPVGGTY